MTDYYESLGLDPHETTSEINQRLSKLESTWKRREITNPEKSTTMLALIIQARKVFASDSLRRQYDRDLQKSKEKPIERNPVAEREQQFNKWYDDAVSYAESKQYDLAKTAIDKAYSYYDPASENDVFFSVIAAIYRLNQDYTIAISHINNAIILNQTEASYYILKAKILYDKSCSPNEYNKQNDSRSAMDTLNHAITLAHNNHDRESESEAYGLLAWISYYQSASDKQKSEELAKNSVQLGDVGGYGSQILNRIEEERQAQLRLKEEQRKREEQYEKEKAAREAENERNRKLAEERHAEEERKSKLRSDFYKRCTSRFKGAFTACIIWWICVIPFFVLEVKMSSNKSGEDFLRDVIIMEVVYFIISIVYSLYNYHGSTLSFPGLFTAFMCIGFFIFWLFPVELIGGWLTYRVPTNNVTIPSSIIYYVLMIVFKLFGTYAIKPPKT